MDGSRQKDFMIQEKLVAKIRQIVVDEKFKLDAFYLCGAASSLPNQKLQKACENYLTMIDQGQKDKDVIARLIAELENAVSTKSKVTVVGDLVNNKADIKEVFDHREHLWHI